MRNLFALGACALILAGCGQSDSQAVSFNPASAQSVPVGASSARAQAQWGGYLEGGAVDLFLEQIGENEIVGKATLLLGGEAIPMTVQGGGLITGGAVSLTLFPRDPRIDTDEYELVGELGGAMELYDTQTSQSYSFNSQRGEVRSFAGDTLKLLDDSLNINPASLEQFEFELNGYRGKGSPAAPRENRLTGRITINGTKDLKLAGDFEIRTDSAPMVRRGRVEAGISIFTRLSYIECTFNPGFQLGEFALLFDSRSPGGHRAGQTFPLKDNSYFEECYNVNSRQPTYAGIYYPKPNGGSLIRILNPGNG